MLFYIIFVLNLIVTINRAINIWTMFDGTGFNTGDTSTSIGDSEVATVNNCNDGTSGCCNSGSCLMLHATNQANSLARWRPTFDVTSYNSLHLSFKYYHNGKDSDVDKHCDFQYNCGTYTSPIFHFLHNANKVIRDYSEGFSFNCDESSLQMTFLCEGNEGGTNSANLYIDNFVLSGNPAPTRHPTRNPTNPTVSPVTNSPTNNPTSHPTSDPSSDPTSDPTADPTSDPTQDPTADPTQDPSKDPTKDPTTEPTYDPTTDPTTDPTKDPTTEPTTQPSTEPTSDPTAYPTTEPTINPTEFPTIMISDTNLVCITKFNQSIFIAIGAIVFLALAAYSVCISIKYWNLKNEVNLKQFNEAMNNGILLQQTGGVE
eukprot:370272_1